jgi:hypothetical protein
MPSAKQQFGAHGEALVARYCPCPKCKRQRTLRSLPPNFKCADLICDFCGYLAQVKSIATANVDALPKKVLGAAWRVQKERMNAGIYFPLFIVLVNPAKQFAIYYLSADLQGPGLFVKRKPLSTQARRAGWQGFVYDLGKAPKGGIIRLL